MAEHKGYDISPTAKRKVEERINDYYLYLEKINEISIEDEDYYFVPNGGYDRIVTSKTNTISKTTELQAIRISEKRAERDLAEATIEAIDRGIRRAARTSARIDLREKLRQDLFENMVEKKPRHLFDRHTKTFQKYRRRAFYYIAEEMGVLDD